MRSEASHERMLDDIQKRPKGLPKPTTSFRRRAWMEFQKAIDPLAPPKPLRIGRR